ncbi:MAG: sigma-70 family RNA polymerase sigma factor [Planctomycetota bacterium]
MCPSSRRASRTAHSGDAPIDEATLCEALREGSDEAVQLLFERHFRPLYRFVLSRVGGRHEDCEEIVQETFVAAVDSIHRFRADSSLYTWLCGIARRKALRSFRRKRLPAISWTETGAALDELLRCEKDLPPETLQRQETVEAVQLALSLLPPDHQEVLLEQYFQGRSVPQIAERWDRSPKAIESLLVRARRALEKTLRRLQSGWRSGEDPRQLDPRVLESEIES